MKKLTFLFTLSVLFLIGCNTEDLSTLDSSIENDSYAKGITKAPEQSGMYVIRTERIFADILVDTKTGLTLLTGIDYVALCSGDPNFLEVEPTQFVDIPNNAERFIELLQGDQYTTVFDGIFDYSSMLLCDFVFNTPVLAEGISRLIHNDNDVFGTVDNNTNTWNFKLHGRLLNQDNEIKNLSAKFHEVWDEKHYYSSVSVRLH